jgi:hypothetical protein
VAEAGHARETPTGREDRPIKIGDTMYEGGDGSTMETAVIIRNAVSEAEGVRAEAKWVNKVHPGWRKGEQALLNEKGRAYDRITYTTPAGEPKVLYFDITAFFGKE